MICFKTHLWYFPELPYLVNTFPLLSLSRNMTVFLFDAFYELESNDDSPTTFLDAIKSLNEFFEEIHSKFVSVLKKNQMIHISFNHDHLRYPISIGYLNKEDMTVEMMQNEFEKVTQSFKHTNINKIENTHLLQKFQF